MRVHFYTKGNILLADSRQRAFNIAHELHAYGIETIIHHPPVLTITETPWPKKAALIIAVIRSLLLIKRDDVVFLQRTISNKYFFILLSFYVWVFRPKMIFDFDDAIYIHNPIKTKIFVRLASAVIVCSEALADWVCPQNSHVYVMHTTLQLAAYEIYTHDYANSAGPVSICWIGTARNHQKNLLFLAQVFKRLVLATQTPFEFVLVSEKLEIDSLIRNLFESVKGLRVVFKEYRDPKHALEIMKDMDVGVNPLVDSHVWNLSRSSFKPYEYMACGIAHVTSAIGEILTVVKDGENGLLASSEDEWVAKLQKIIEDKELRVRLGRAGQETMRSKESYEAVMPRLVDIIKNL